MLKIVGVIIWALFSSLIAADILKVVDYEPAPWFTYSGYPELEPPTFVDLTHGARPGLALWLLTWVTGIILWIVLSSLWRRLRSPARKAGKHS